MSFLRYWRVWLLLLLFVSMLLGAYIFFLIRERQLLKAALDKAPVTSANFVVAEGSIFFDCQADFSQIQKSLITLSESVVLRRWLNCYFLDKANQKQVIALALFVENYQSQTIFTSLGLNASSGLDRPMVDPAIDQHIDGIIKTMDKSKGLRSVNITTGKDSGSLLINKDPLRDLLKTTIGEQMMTFGRTGQVSDLPTFSGLNAPLIIPYRITLLP